VAPTNKGIRERKKQKKEGKIEKGSSLLRQKIRQERSLRIDASTKGRTINSAERGQLLATGNATERKRRKRGSVQG